MDAYRLLRCAAAALILAGCQKRSQPANTTQSMAVAGRSTSEMMQLVSPSIAAGEKAVVRFSRPLDPAGDRYWVTLIEAGQADSQWGDWQYVDRTTREVTLPAAATPGRYEVRLHDRYPAMPHHVVARSALTVTGSSKAVSSPNAAVDSQPAHVTAVAATAPISAAAPVPAADVAAMAATDFGPPSTRIEPVLHVQRWAKDGGGHEIVSPSEGHRFLVVEFPRTATLSGQIFYDSRQVSLRSGVDALQPYAVTTGGASARSSARTPDGRRVFQREVYASQYAPDPDLPFAVVFHIPAGATGGTLRLGSRESALSW